MARESQLQEYQRKAREADRAEELAKDPEVKLAWERIAVGYWELAEYVARRDSILILRRSAWS